MGWLVGRQHSTVVTREASVSNSLLKRSIDIHSRRKQLARYEVPRSCALRGHVGIGTQRKAFLSCVAVLVAPVLSSAGSESYRDKPVAIRARACARHFSKA